MAIGSAIGYFWQYLPCYYLTSSLPVPYFHLPDKDRQQHTRNQSFALSTKTKTSELLGPRALCG